MAPRKRYFGRVYIDIPDDFEKDELASGGTSVYIPINVSHTLYDDDSLRTACNLHEYSTIEKKSTILSVNLSKTPYLVWFRITLRSTKDSKILKMSIYAVKRHLLQSTGEILNRIVRAKVWKLNDETYELIQIMGPKERVKRILGGTEETKKDPPKDFPPKRTT